LDLIRRFWTLQALQLLYNLKLYLTKQKRPPSGGLSVEISADVLAEYSYRTLQRNPDSPDDRNTDGKPGEGRLAIKAAFTNAK
jgi:hypothetical protein